MPTVFTHAAVGYAMARAASGRRRLPTRLLVVAAALPVVPDLDVLLHPWFGWGHPLGHRGLSHSLLFALLLGGAAALLCRGAAAAAPGGLAAVALLFAAATASHPVLDALTTGGLGMPFFMPFSNARHFFPIRPIPVSPIRPSWFFSDWGMFVLQAELFLVWPFAAAAVVWSGDGGRLRVAAGFLLAAVGTASWAWRLGRFALAAASPAFLG